jgi:hypothetical protein
VIVPAWDGVYFYVRMTSTSVRDTFLYVLEEIPTLFLLTLYSQQLLVWAQSYHTATNTMDIYRYIVVRGIWACNIFTYVLQILVWILFDHTTNTIDPDAWSLTTAILHALAFLGIALGLLRYGLGVRKSVQTVPVGLQLRIKQMQAILRVTAICSLAFLIRAIALVIASYAAFIDVDGFDESLTPSDLSLSVLFFLFTELLPLLIILNHNRNIPTLRKSRSGTSSSFSPLNSRRLRNNNKDNKDNYNSISGYEQESTPDTSSMNKSLGIRLGFSSAKSSSSTVSSTLLSASSNDDDGESSFDTQENTPLRSFAATTNTLRETDSTPLVNMESSNSSNSNNNNNLTTYNSVPMESSPSESFPSSPTTSTTATKSKKSKSKK